MAVLDTPRTHSDARTAEPATGVGSPLITISDLRVLYEGDLALEGVSLTLMEGERVAIIGPNGAGKSTLLKVIMGLLQPQAGSVTIAGKGLARLGYVPQHEAVNWDFPVTVRDVVMMGRVRRIGWLRWPSRADWRAVDEALDRVEMGQFARRQVGDLSGGQRRRVFIARALAQDTDTLVLDEPFAGVDAGAQAGLMDVLDALNQGGITVVLSTHDLNLAFQRFDTVVALHERLIAFGKPQEIYTPAMLAALYGGRLTLMGEDEQVAMFVDDPGCHGC